MVREIEVEDPSPEPAPEAQPSPYRNLLVPLVVVPFMVVGVLALVFVFFGAITGSEASIEDNLERMVRGGANEKKQAAMSLSSQAAENARARLAGEAEPWPVGPEFLERLASAWTEIDEDDRRLRLTVAQLAASYGDPQAFDRLATFLALPEEADRDAQLRFAALMALSWLDDSRSADLVIPFTRHSDALLRQTAAGLLQKMPGEKSRAALVALLGDPALELRGQAAISLSYFGDAAGAGVLVELVDPASYAAAHQADAKKYASARVVQESRCRAIQALARLGRDSDRALFERVAASDDDALVREAALRVLQRR
jgi:HEAT repeat protein